MLVKSRRLGLSTALLSTWISLPLSALCTQPPVHGGPMPLAFKERLDKNPLAFTFKRSLIAVAERAAIAREASISRRIRPFMNISQISDQVAAALAPTGRIPSMKVQGARRIPVLLVNFSDSAAPKYAAKQLQQQLFDGPWPTGTMTQFYTENSNGALTVTGTVYQWTKLARPGSYYQGGDYQARNGETVHCYGLCQDAKMPDFIKEAVASNPSIDWGQFDNEGPDGNPNSGDDDGYVDFVAFVHSGIGGECRGANNTNIWSHRSSITSWGVPAIVTPSKKKGGGYIKIDDYVVMPALACDGTTMIPIGVFAHEFGHAFGLPDLYNTDGDTAGLGNWDLMATGSWGGDGQSPWRPSNMSPWTKDFLGWIDIHDIYTPTNPFTVPAVETSNIAYRIPISSSLYYLVSVVNRTGFNEHLPASGLQIWLVNRTEVESGMATNRVNADPYNPGVKLIEADGLDQLSKPGFRGGPNDLFPGGLQKRVFDSATQPQSLGSIALCNISDPTNQVSAAFYKSGSCAAPQPVAPANPQILVQAAPPSPAAPSPPTAIPGMVEGVLVTLKGKLTNLGSNYFDRKSRRIVLVDDAGRVIDIAPATALETFTAPNQDPKRPQSLSNFLGKQVEIKGVVSKGSVGSASAEVKAHSISVLQ